MTNTVVRIDPQTGEALQSIEDVVVKPENLRLSGMAAGEGGVWFGNFATIQHIDPVTSTTGATIPVDSPFLRPFVAFRTVWVATDDGVERINPATDELLDPVELEPVGGIAVPSSITATRDELWVALEKTLYRVDPLAGTIEEQVELGASSAIAAGEGAVWVVDELSGLLSKVEPDSGDVVASTTLAGSLDGLAAGAGAVWILDRSAGIVTVVDPHTLAPEATIRVGDDEHEIVFGLEAVWLADGEGRSVTRIDPLTRKPTIFPMGGPVAHVAVDEGTGDVWVLLGDPSRGG